MTKIAKDDGFKTDPDLERTEHLKFGMLCAVYEIESYISSCKAKPIIDNREVVSTKTPNPLKRKNKTLK